jgi:hypothetical protein
LNSHREYQIPDYSSNFVGFRCAWSPCRVSMFVRCAHILRLLQKRCTSTRHKACSLTLFLMGALMSPAHTKTELILNYRLRTSKRITHVILI